MIPNDSGTAFSDLPAAVVGRLLVTHASQEQAIDLLGGSAPGLALHLCNAYTVVAAEASGDRSQMFGSHSFLIPDGTPVARALAHRLGRSYTGPVRGPDLMREMLRRGGRHYFYGSTPSTLERLAAVVSHDFPQADVCGTSAPPFGEISGSWYAALEEDLVRTRPDFVWVGLGTPKQDVFTSAMALHHPRAKYIAIGAAFDFLSGQVAEAPRLLHHSGLEWLYRLCVEPRRLWRRYLLGNVRFLVLLATDRSHRRPG